MHEYPALIADVSNWGPTEMVVLAAAVIGIADSIRGRFRDWLKSRDQRIQRDRTLDAAADKLLNTKMDNKLEDQTTRIINELGQKVDGVKADLATHSEQDTTNFDELRDGQMKHANQIEGLATMVRNGNEHS